MKKYTWLIFCLCLGSLAWGENLSFMTTMSGPVGSFSQVDATDKAVVATTTLYNVGTIILDAASDNRTASLGNVEVGVNGGSATLASNTSRFKVGNLTLNPSAELKGGRLIAQSITDLYDGQGFVKGTLYGGTVQVNRLGVQGKLIVGSNSQISQNASYSDLLLSTFSWNSVGTGTGNMKVLQGTIIH